jgi:5-(carboxyamino)imidazole ribonucleotide synthase
MLALSAVPLGIPTLFLDRGADTPAGQIAPILIGEFTDHKLLRELAIRSSVLSFDWENVSVDALRAATRGTRARIAPSLRALSIAQDRLSEKRLFESLKIPTTDYAAVDSLPALRRAVARIGCPGVLKTRRLGYDGKGQYVLRREADITAAWTALGSAPLLYENRVPFDYEVSAIAARGRDGDMAIYPLNRNIHQAGILRLTLAPWKNPALERAAFAAIRRVMQHLHYVGVLTIEFFVREGKLIANEIAPRVHNSGHWTIEGAATSQFENHIRAIAGLPLGVTTARGHSAMINLIGKMPGNRRFLAMPDVHLHDYCKSPRAARKVGHLTVVSPDIGARDALTRNLMNSLYPRLRGMI